MSRRFGSQEPRIESGDILVNQGNTDADVNRIEDSFNRLMGKVGVVVNRSVALVSQMRDKLDQTIQTTFLNNTQKNLKDEDASDPFYSGRDSGFMQGVGLDEVLDSFFDFGRSVVEEFGAVVTQVFGDLNEAVEEEKKQGQTECSLISLCTVCITQYQFICVYVNCSELYTWCFRVSYHYYQEYNQNLKLQIL